MLAGPAKNLEKNKKIKKEFLFHNKKGIVEYAKFYFASFFSDKKKKKEENSCW